MFKKLLKKVPKSIDKMSVTEIINNIAHCNAMNSKSIIEADAKREENIWLNPHNQNCFESGWYTVEDFRDWANGIGKIVKGDTPEHQAKFMEYNKAEKELDSYLFMYFNYLWMLKDDGRMNAYGTLMYKSDAHFIDKSKDDMYIVQDILSSFVPEFQEDFKYRKCTDIRDEHRSMGWGIKKTLSLLGYTKIGACNTPTELTNIGWSWDLVYAKAYYLHCIETGINLPDIKFVQDNYYTTKGEFKK